MSVPTPDELLQRFGKSDDPKVKARRQHILEVLLNMNPEMKQRLVEEAIEEAIEKGIQKGRLVEARVVLRRVLAGRRLELRPEDKARIKACAHLATLQRWLDQSLTAPSAAEALR